MLGVTHIAGLVLGLLEVWRCQRAARLWGRRELEGVARPAIWLGRGWQESPRLVAVQTRLGPVRRTRRVNETLGRTEGKLSLFFKFPKNSSSKRQTVFACKAKRYELQWQVPGDGEGVFGCPLLHIAGLIAGQAGQSRLLEQKKVENINTWPSNVTCREGGLVVWSSLSTVYVPVSLGDLSLSLSNLSLV